MNKQSISPGRCLIVQGVVAAAFLVSWSLAAPQARSRVAAVVTGDAASPPVSVPRRTPLVVTPLYDDSEVVSDEELGRVLDHVLPRFPRGKLRPNHVEHALRTWGVDAEFADPRALSGVELRDFLIDHGRYLASWGADAEPLLIDRARGVSVRWKNLADASVHHDHWLASLTEAGIALGQPVYTPARRDMTIDDVLQESLRDLRLDETEVEWSALAFGLWLPPLKTWTTRDGRRLSFDRLATRLMRGHQRLGVCSGTHRAYSLMALVRLDDDFAILSPPVREAAYAHLAETRDLIAASQFPDGHWPSNWAAGKAALETPLDDELYRQVIATGHHLEWLAIAPEELHPPRAQIRKAADWVIGATLAQSEEQILGRYTFFSHIGNALALWRGTRPAEFWPGWEIRAGERKAENTAFPVILQSGLSGSSNL